MRLVKMQAMQLQPGMFVAELDRPWLETPFALQGFMVRTEEEVLYIAEYVDHVFVDAEYHGSPLYLPVQLMRKQEVAQKINIKAEFQQAKISFESATETLDNVFNKLSHGENTKIEAVREAVRPLIDGVFRNKDAVAALVRLKKVGDYQYQHGISMAVWAAILGRHIGLHRDELEKLVTGCAMCDVGMTKVPESILKSDTPLTEDERLAMEQHPLIGAEMVEKSDDVDFEILAIIENHHERHNGSGYPRGVEGAAIPLLARIAGLVDSYDAMITSKPYAVGRTSFEAIQELIDTKDQLFPGVLVEQFVQAVGLYPTGSLVELNTGELAIVIKQNNLRRLKPELVVVADANKQTKPVLEMVDLAKVGSGKDERWISRELPPGAYNINREDYFLS